MKRAVRITLQSLFFLVFLAGMGTLLYLSAQKRHRISCSELRVNIVDGEKFVTAQQIDAFILRAYGDSMIEAGIDDGDLVLIRQQNYADDGQIVVALMEDEATLKRFYPEPEKHRVRLHPENSAMEDIIVDNCVIQGVAVKVLKDLE